MEIAHKYAFERIGGGNPEWPSTVEPTLPLVAVIDSICDDLEALVPKPATQERISASPGAYLPALKYILSCYEAEHRVAEASEEEPDYTSLPRLFSISPKPSTKWRFISINAELLASLLPIAAPNDPSDYAQVFFEVFDFSRFGFDRYGIWRYISINSESLYIHVL